MSSMNPLLKSLGATSLTANRGKAMKIVLSILAALVIIVALVMFFTKGMTGAAHDQLAAIKAGNMEAAYNMSSSEFQKSTPMEKFKGYIDQFPILKNFKSVSFTERKVDGGSGYIGGTIEDANGSEMKIEYQLVKEDDHWKVLGMQLTPMEKK